MRVRGLSFAFAASLLAADASATLINVAAGKPVTLNGEFGVMTCCWLPGALAPGATLVDEAFLPAASIWQTDTVWWDERNPESIGNSIEIDLLGTFSLVGFVVQADDNDTYRIEYQDALDNWVTAWDIPAVGGFGMQTRPNPFDVSEVFMLAAAIETDRLRFTATDGDLFYSVSEIQAYVVPEPGTATLLALGGAGLAARLRRGRRDRSRS
jgi:hypothetical protein